MKVEICDTKIETPDGPVVGDSIWHALRAALETARLSGKKLVGFWLTVDDCQKFDDWIYMNPTPKDPSELVFPHPAFLATGPLLKTPPPWVHEPAKPLGAYGALPIYMTARDNSYVEWLAKHPDRNSDR